DYYCSVFDNSLTAYIF
nr:immunoglobulin light chain junction region [Macaca mulatta]MOW68403.1 immunoglobulin light chain junction region [Macaca mulatta]MOW68469.1 immunoglobulin light chain junction region [Macaca mulatta]MOW71741.1 immunoglobulin light chain junction region [Macaca mulatta]